jgi:hypothetical protein
VRQHAIEIEINARVATALRGSGPMIEVDLQNWPTGTKHKPKKPVDRDAIRKKHRDAHFATQKLLAKIRRERRNRK